MTFRRIGFLLSAVLVLLCLLSLPACAPRKVAVLPAPPSDIRREPPVGPQAVPSLPPAVPPLPPTATAVAAPAPAPPPDYPRMYREAIAASRRALAGTGIGEAVRAWELLEGSPWAQDAVFNKGVLLHLSGDVEGAAAMYRRLASQRPVFEPAAANLLGIHILRGDREDLGRLADALLPQGESPSAGTLPELAVNLAAACVELGRLERARTILAGLGERGSRSPAATWSRAILAARSGDTAAARELAMKIPRDFADLFPVTASRRAWEPEDAAVPDIEIPPTAENRMVALARNLKAFTLYREGRYDEAERTISGTPEKGAFPGEALSNLALVKLSQGKWSVARALLERATREHPGSPGGWINLGVYRELYEGNAPGAAECYKKYVGLNGTRKDEVAKWIERLQVSPSR